MGELGPNLCLSTPIFSLQNQGNSVLVNGDPYDLCIVCTYDQFSPSKTPVFYESTIMLTYQKKKDPPVGALTIVDGEFCSLYPYTDYLYTLSSVRLTPFFSSQNIHECYKAKDEYKPSRNVIDRFEQEITYFTDWFRDCFEYEGYITSIKTKPYDDKDADREFISEEEGNILRVFSGKINNVILGERAVSRFISKH